MCKPELTLLCSNPREVIFRDLGMRLPFLKGDYWLHGEQNDFVLMQRFPLQPGYGRGTCTFLLVDMPNCLQTATSDAIVSWPISIQRASSSHGNRSF